MKIPFLRTNGKYSLIDLDNKKISEKKYDNLDFFYDGYAKVFSYDTWHYMDENEKFLKLDNEYEQIFDFVNGLAEVKRNDLSWCINKNGVEVSRRGYNEFYRFCRQFIKLSAGLHYISSYDDYNGQMETCVGESFEGLLDSNGFEIIPPIGECYIMNVTEDFILLNRGSVLEVVNFSGQRLYKTYEYSRISSYYRNRAIAVLKATNEICIISEKFKLIKSLGNANIYSFADCYVINGQTMDGFINGLYTLKKDGKYGVIDIAGNIISEYQYETLCPFIDEFTAAAKIINGSLKYTILNSNCDEIIPFKYDKIDGFYEGCASVELNGKWGVIDFYGNEIIEPQFDNVGYCSNGFITVSKGDYNLKDYYGKYGVYNKQGEKICPIMYDSIYISGNLIIIELRGKYGLLDRQGRSITKIKFDRIEKVNYSEFLEKYESFVFVEKDNKRFVVNDKGVEFVENPADDLNFL